MHYVLNTMHYVHSTMHYVPNTMYYVLTITQCMRSLVYSDTRLMSCMNCFDLTNQ